MNILKVGWNETDHFCPLSFPFNVRFQNFLKLSVQPISYRKFDPTSKRWSVHITKIVFVVTYAKSVFDHVDYSALPEDVQLQIAMRSTGRGKHSPAVAKISSPYEVLHLLPSAPIEVVKAAYKALAMLHHPDRGGDEEVFKEINSAFEAITTVERPSEE